MATAITAKLGLDIGPLQKGLAEASKVQAAASKKDLDAAKKNSAEHSRAAKEALGKVTTGLIQAGNAGEAAAVGFEAIGSLGKGSAIAGAAAFGAVLAKGLWDSHVAARELHRELEFLSRPTLNASNASGGDITGQINENAARLSEWIKTKRTGLFPNRKYAASDLIGILKELGDGGAAFKTRIGEMADIVIENYRLIGEQAKAASADNAVAQTHFQYGGAQGDLAAAQLRAEREKAAVSRELLTPDREGVTKGRPEDVARMHRVIDDRLRLEEQSLQRAEDEAKREAADATRSEAQRANNQIAATYNKRAAIELEITRISEERARELKYAAETEDADRKRSHEARAAHLQVELAAARQQKVLELEKTPAQRLAERRAGRHAEHLSHRVDREGIISPDEARRRAIVEKEGAARRAIPGRAIPGREAGLQEANAVEKGVSAAMTKLGFSPKTQWIPVNN